MNNKEEQINLVAEIVDKDCRFNLIYRTKTSIRLTYESEEKLYNEIEKNPNLLNSLRSEAIQMFEKAGRPLGEKEELEIYIEEKE